MRTLTVEDRQALRRLVQADVNKFFRQTILISERVFRHVELSYELMSTTGRSRGETFLARSIKDYPALLLALNRVGISRDMLRDTAGATKSEVLRRYYNNPSMLIALEKTFHMAGDPNQPRVRSAVDVKSSRSLRMEDMLIGPLEAASTDWGLTRYIVEALVDKKRSSTLSLTFERDAFYANIIEQLRLIRDIDDSASDQQFVLSFDGQRYRLQPFGVWGAHLLSESPLPDGSAWLARGNVLQPLGARFHPDAIAELEDLINRRAKEIDFQKFFERHPEFILTLGPYTKLHPQLIITEDDGRRLIPDFFLEKINSDFCDICDLKRPTAELVRYQRSRHRFRDAVMEAVAQLDTYRDWFEDSHHRTAFHQQYGLRLFRPNVVIIIGRRRSYYDEVQRIRLESRLPRWVQLSTYDDVLDRAREWTDLARSE